MKINEIIAESQGKFRAGLTKSSPGLKSYPDLDNGNVPYLQYRMGLAMASAPRLADEAGPTGSQFLTISYTDADEEILNVACKAMGITAMKQGSSKSVELDSTHKQSPVQARGPIALKKKK